MPGFVIAIIVICIVLFIALVVILSSIRVIRQT